MAAPGPRVVRHFAGLDLGQARDYSALCDIERVDRATGEIDHATMAPLIERRYGLRFLERFELGTSYPQVVARTAEVCGKLSRPELVVDGTGVGRVVVDLFADIAMAHARGEALPRVAPYVLVPVTITSGDRTSFVDGFWRVPKRDLVGSLLVMFQTGELAIAEGLALASVLVKELLNFRMAISAEGRDSYGNWREAPNDDLVLSVALAAWRARRGLPPVHGLRRLL